MKLTVEPQTLTRKRTEYGKLIRKDYESGKTKERISIMTQYEPRNDGICGTLTTVLKDNYINEPQIRQVGQIYPNSGNPQAGRVYDSSGISAALDTCSGGNRMPKVVEELVPDAQNSYIKDDEHVENTKVVSNFPDLHDKETELSFRIRKLTPKECFRLMGFSDIDFDKASSVNSNSQLYKQAGNSIVVNVLEAIFKNMLRC